MPVDAEEVQEIGRQGVATIKRWLEATTYLELPFDAYHHVPECTVIHLTGKKKFDLNGYYLIEDKQPIYVECKRYGSPGRQYKEFQRFLGIAYSRALQDRDDYGRIRPIRWLWVTYHPFNLDRWKHLETHDEMRLALDNLPEYVGAGAIDEDVLRDVASRVMVLVFNPKQETLSLTRQELQLIRAHIERKAPSV